LSAGICVSDIGTGGGVLGREEGTEVAQAGFGAEAAEVWVLTAATADHPNPPATPRARTLAARAVLA
jgi:hypothetical protein